MRILVNKLFIFTLILKLANIDCDEVKEKEECTTNNIGNLKILMVINDTKMNVNE